MKQMARRVSLKEAQVLRFQCEQLSCRKAPHTYEYTEDAGAADSVANFSIGSVAWRK